MEITKLIFDFDKLPTRLVLIVLILSGLIMFLPSETLTTLKLAEFNKNYGQWIGITFLGTAAFVAISIFTSIKNWYSYRQLKFGVEKEIRNTLSNLDPVEKSIIREFFLIGSTINLPSDQPQVVGLLNKHIIRMAQSNLEGLFFMGGIEIPYLLNGYAREVIGRNINLVDLPMPVDGKYTEEQQRQLVETRPPWTRRGFGNGFFTV